MDYYIDIRLKPDPEFNSTILMNAVFSKAHKALCHLHSVSIGVSFPRYKKTLGDLMRIHGTAEALGKLQSLNWIGGMREYCEPSNIELVPTGAKFRVVSRKQTTMSNAKLNRLLKRGTITGDQVNAYKAKMFNKGLDNPYIELKSGSNGHRHRRYLEFGPLLDNPVEGTFDQFGLSKIATIPWF
ncbi:MAG: type I-F CRISPR-associated endoribonuclease Cas6/Csy4 [bacterium]